MSARPIIDAGPVLNFLSINKERLLIGVLGVLSAPETVQDEVLRKSRQDERFHAAATVWRKLTPRWMQILSDDVTPELAAVVHRISGIPMDDRIKHSKDLGETRVIAHAVVAAEACTDVTVLIDDGPGARIVTSEISRLQRLRASGRTVGTIRLASTPVVLERAADTEHIKDKATMRDIYTRLRGIDDGLPPIETTNLLCRPSCGRGRSAGRGAPQHDDAAVAAAAYQVTNRCTVVCGCLCSSPQQPSRTQRSTVVILPGLLSLLSAGAPGAIRTHTGRVLSGCWFRPVTCGGCAGQARRGRVLDVRTSPSRSDALDTAGRQAMCQTGVTTLLEVDAVTTNNADMPLPPSGPAPSVDELFQDTPPTRSADELAREGVFEEGEVEEFIADLYAMRRADAA